MKRRVLLAKALVHEPEVVFIDEPTATVDVNLRREMWRLVLRLKAKGVTVVLTTHYHAEAEEIADRIGIIVRGRMLLVEDRSVLMVRFRSKEVSLYLSGTWIEAPPRLPGGLQLAPDGDPSSIARERCLSATYRAY